jgi:hypothetical protein
MEILCECERWIIEVEPGFWAHRRTITRWLCRCSCGQTTTVDGQNLRQGGTRSCGCLTEPNLDRWVTHGLNKGGQHPLATTYHMMKRRCLQPNSRSWRNYGGRGIAICDRWINDFAAFVEDVGPRPGPGYTLDRMDNDGNYQPGNVRWATASEQRLNQRLSENPNRQTKQARNVSGCVGVSLTRSRNRSKPWQAHIYINGRTKNLGSFATIEEAAEQRINAEFEYLGKVCTANEAYARSLQLIP